MVSAGKECWLSHWVVWVAPILGSLLAVFFYGLHSKLGNKVHP
jgi:glycerol uptake facilitator-like aquaporin